MDDPFAFDQLFQPAPAEQEQHDDDGNNISLQTCLDALPILRPEDVVRPELRIALPGVDEAKVDEIIQTTLNLQTDQTLDPLRVAHSFSAAEQRRRKQVMHRKVVMYLLSSE